MTNTTPDAVEVDTLDVLIVNLRRLGTGEVALGATVDGAELVPILVLGADTVLMPDGGLAVDGGLHPQESARRTIGITVPVVIELVSSLLARGFTAAITDGQAAEQAGHAARERSAYL